jgi:hypothetical protein
MSRKIIAFVLSGILLVSGGASRGGTVQWDFNGDVSSSTGGADLELGAAAPASVPEVNFDLADIGVDAAEVAIFGRGTYFKFTHGFPPNGGGIYVNQYTLILDVMFPDRSPSSGWAALLQTSTANAGDGDWFVNPGSGLGISGNYGGILDDGVWHRIALVVDNVAGSFTSYIDGSQVEQIHTADDGDLVVDGRWSLDTTALLFADQDGENAGGMVNSVQIRDTAMTADELLGLGGPDAAGIFLPSDPRDCLFRNFSVAFDPLTGSVNGTWVSLPGDQGFRVFEGARQIGGDLPANATGFNDPSPPAGGAAVKYTLEPLRTGRSSAGATPRRSRRSPARETSPPRSTARRSA